VKAAVYQIVVDKLHALTKNWRWCKFNTTFCKLCTTSGFQKKCVL